MNARRFLAACFVGSVVVLWSPFMGLLRSNIRARFPTHFIAIFGAIVAVSIVALLGIALSRIRDRRPLRYGALAAALILGALYSLAMRSGRLETDVVEAFHFVEYAVVTLLFYRAVKSLDDGSMFLLPIFCGLVVATFEEAVQWFVPNRVGELRDVFLNLAAIVCGLLFSVAVDPPERLTFAMPRASIRRAGRFAAVAVLVLAAFLWVVQVGYAIDDPETGVFKTRYSAAQLAELSRERAERWKVNPPPLTLQRISREDQYLSEAALHAQERNLQWEQGNIAGAWRENRVLEKYYAPTLDAKWYGAKTGFRWPPEQRADAETRFAAAPPIAYATKVNADFIFAWPQTTFWLVVAAVAVLLALV